MLSIRLKLKIPCECGFRTCMLPPKTPNERGKGTEPKSGLNEKLFDQYKRSNKRTTQNWGK